MTALGVAGEELHDGKGLQLGQDRRDALGGVPRGAQRAPRLGGIAVRGEGHVHVVLRIVQDGEAAVAADQLGGELAQAFQDAGLVERRDEPLSDAHQRARHLGLLLDPAMRRRQRVLRARADDGHARDVGGGLEQPPLARAGPARLAIVHREGAEAFLPGRQDGGRPARLQAVLQGEIAVVLPQRIRADVAHDDRAAVKRRRAARSDLRADRDAVDAATIALRQRGTGAVSQPVPFEQEHGAEEPGHLLLHHPAERVEHLGERRTGGDHLENARLPGQQLRETHGLRAPADVAAHDDGGADSQRTGRQQRIARDAERHGDRGEPQPDGHAQADRMTLRGRQEVDGPQAAAGAPGRLPRAAVFSERCQGQEGRG